MALLPDCLTSVRPPPQPLGSLRSPIHPRPGVVSGVSHRSEQVSAASFPIRARTLKSKKKPRHLPHLPSPDFSFAEALLCPRTAIQGSRLIVEIASTHFKLFACAPPVPHASPTSFLMSFFKLDINVNDGTSGADSSIHTDRPPVSVRGRLASLLLWRILSTSTLTRLATSKTFLSWRHN